MSIAEGEKPDSGPHYWDWNATTPPHPDVVAGVQQASLQAWANPSSQHQLGRAARASIENVRDLLGARLGTRPRDVLFAGSGTEANNLALRGGSTIVTSRLEHPSVVRVAEEQEASGGNVHWLPIPSEGCVSPHSVERTLSELDEAQVKEAVVCVAGVNHETGVVQPVSDISKVVAAFGARLHIDAAQSFGKSEHGELHGRLSFTVVGHKIRGPKGVAALAWRDQIGPAPVLLGGSQERGLRPGTVSTPLVIGLGIAVERVDPSRHDSLAVVRDFLENSLKHRATFHGSSVPRAAHVSNLRIPGWTGERLAAALDVRGICVSTGSACSVGTAQPSAAVTAMLGENAGRGAIRISFGETTTLSGVKQGVQTFIKLLDDAARHRS